MRHPSLTPPPPTPAPCFNKPPFPLHVNFLLQVTAERRQWKRFGAAARETDGENVTVRTVEEIPFDRIRPAKATAQEKKFTDMQVGGSNPAEGTRRFCYHCMLSFWTLRTDLALEARPCLTPDNCDLVGKHGQREGSRCLTCHAVLCRAVPPDCTADKQTIVGGLKDMLHDANAATV